MGVICTTPKAAIDEFFEKSVSLIRQYMLNALTKLGEECVVRIRDRGPQESWIDRTGNLRSSIGYAVYDHGVKYMQGTFTTVKNGSQGSAKGRQMIEQMAQEYSNVLALVVVAAMDYAERVEALENKDVLESTRIWAQSVVESKLNRAKEEAIKVINTWDL